MKHYGDITKISGYAVEPVDVITGGSPCQDLSVAGKRAGMSKACPVCGYKAVGNSEEDICPHCGSELGYTRSGLFMEQIRIIKEMRQNDRDHGRAGMLVRPRYCIWENVPGAFSSNGGKDFQAVLTEFVKVCDPSAPDVPMPEKGGWPHAGILYDEMGGWSVAYRQHDAQYWGVPQRRKRICVLADFNGLTAGEILFDAQLWGEAAYSEPDEALRDFGGFSAPEVLFERKGLSGDSAESGEKRERTSCASESGPAYSIQGNTVDRAAKQNGLGISEDVAPTLAATDRHAVCFPDKVSTLPARMDGSPCIDRGPPIVAVYENHGQDSRIKELGDVCEMVSYKYGTGGNNQPLVVSIGNGQLHQMTMSDKANTLDTMHDQQAVLIAYAPDTGHALNVNSNNIVLIWPEVRRLTPLECERLQGYRDGWTDIGEWTDSNGKKHKVADNPRYKALGNSIALPFWQWLARKICAQYERRITMASLFDGIGGFPLAFSAAGAVPIWASEIEEFPIAVTRKHFPEVEV